MLEIWGYWILEPALLLGPKDPVHLQHYVLNWLRAQLVWLYMLQFPRSDVVKVATQSWKNFLNGLLEDAKTYMKTGKQAYELRQIFDPDTEGKVLWHQCHIAVVDNYTGHHILWEIFKLGFHYELWALDHIMYPLDSAEAKVEWVMHLAQIFPSNNLWSVPDLPSSESCGLFASLLYCRIQSLNPLCDVLRVWPLYPSVITQVAPLHTGDSAETIEILETWMTLFYTQTFFDTSGWAPIVPHLFLL